MRWRKRLLCTWRQKALTQTYRYIICPREAYSSILIITIDVCKISGTLVWASIFQFSKLTSKSKWIRNEKNFWDFGRFICDQTWSCICAKFQGAKTMTMVSTSTDSANQVNLQKRPIHQLNRIAEGCYWCVICSK